MKPRMKMVFYTGIEKNSNYLLNILHHIFIMTDMQHCNSIGINFLNKLLCFIYNKIKCQCFHETMQRLYTSWWFHLLCLRDIFHFTNHNRKHPPPPSPGTQQTLTATSRGAGYKFLETHCFVSCSP